MPIWEKLSGLLDNFCSQLTFSNFRFLQKWIRGPDARDQDEALKKRKKIFSKGQGPTFPGQTLSRQRIEMVDAKAKDQGHNFSKLWLQNFLLILRAKNFAFR